MLRRAFVRARVLFSIMRSIQIVRPIIPLFYSNTPYTIKIYFINDSTALRMDCKHVRKLKTTAKGEGGGEREVSTLNDPNGVKCDSVQSIKIIIIVCVDHLIPYAHNV